MTDPLTSTVNQAGERNLKYVYKFGGTSLGTAERLLKVVDIVKESHKQGSVAIVLSAMSSEKKDSGTTSRLINAANAVLTNTPSFAAAILSEIEIDHVNALKQAITEPQHLEDAINDVIGLMKNLRFFLQATEVIQEVSPRSKDVIISAGEQLSSMMFTHILNSQGLKAEYVSLEKLITRQFDVRNIDQSFYDYLAEELSIRVGSVMASGKIPIITGYFGPVPGSILSTIGRGYTDLTAALVAVGIKAQELQIWKEVDGIFTADPRKVEKAMLLSSISPEEAAELTYYGSEVIHPFTMEQVIRAKIPIRIKNTFNPPAEGTVIVPENWRPPRHAIAFLDRDSSSSRSCDSPISPDPKKPTAVTVKNNIIVLNVHSNKRSVSHGFFASIFTTLDAYGITVDLISTSEVHVSMALNPSIQTEPLKRAVEDLRRYGTVDIIRNMAIISLVGKQMRNLRGIAGRMFETLAKCEVNIEMISQGASEINISCVIEEEKAIDALRAIHDKCILFPF